MILGEKKGLGALPFQAFGRLGPSRNLAVETAAKNRSVGCFVPMSFFLLKCDVDAYAFLPSYLMLPNKKLMAFRKKGLKITETLFLANHGKRYTDCFFFLPGIVFR